MYSILKAILFEVNFNMLFPVAKVVTKPTSISAQIQPALPIIR